MTKHFGGRRLVFEARDRLGFDDGAAAEVFDEDDPLFPRQRGNVLRERRVHEAVHEEIAAVDFQDEGRLAGDDASIVLERGLVRRADFAQRRAARLEHVRDPESAADLNQLTAGDDDFVYGCPAEMPQDQHQGGGVVVDDRGGFRLAQQREAVLQVSRATASCAAREAVFQVAVIRTDAGQRGHDIRTERGPAEIRVHENAGAVDDRLDAGPTDVEENRPDARNHAVEIGNGLLSPENLEFPAHDVEDHRARQSGVAERVQDFVHRGDRAKARRLHAGDTNLRLKAIRSGPPPLLRSYGGHPSRAIESEGWRRG